MKFLVVFCFVVLAALATVSSQGVPIRKCPPGEHSVLYCPREYEKTCTSPQRSNYPGACDIPDCYCDDGTIRQRNKGKCIPISEC